MISTNFSYFDAAVIGVLLLSCLVAVFRGFVKEVLSLGAWIGAGLVTIYFFPDLAKALKPHFKSEVSAAGVATLSLYVGSLLTFSLINAVIFRFLKEGSDVGILDNMLGLIFGFFRGGFIVSLGFLLLSMAMKEDEYPEWVKEARTLPYVEKGAIALARVAPDYLQEHTALKKKIEAAEGKREMKDPLSLFHKEEKKETRHGIRDEDSWRIERIEEGSPAR